MVPKPRHLGGAGAGGEEIAGGLAFGGHRWSKARVERFNIRGMALWAGRAAQIYLI